MFDDVRRRLLHVAYNRRLPPKQYPLPEVTPSSWSQSAPALGPGNEFNLAWGTRLNGKSYRAWAGKWRTRSARPGAVLPVDGDAFSGNYPPLRMRLRTKRHIWGPRDTSTPVFFLEVFPTTAVTPMVAEFCGTFIS
ncbi:Hypothetical protein NTJ_01658 [Nesidiocoris tenuis]|uniref:Uncharacterized protein n=1 Tax=Nesidiocoris tenuis TaxID=355587 RepID=A0ABN7A963_9HEMI|nr:Hypothetical protein NTJ_01658 [Nesidiocoris tenuis]